LAAAVNLVELVCSAGLPAVYTSVLALADLPAWHYYAYLIFYIIIFMLDDLFVFIVAMTTLRMKALSGRYTKWSGWAGGVLMLIIGLLLLFKPGWIMFG
jgi:threonine/homoserine/homoserine lactone efflux protein